MPTVRPHSVVWLDEDGEEHSRTFYVDPDIATRTELLERGVEVAERSPHGFDVLVAVHEEDQPRPEDCSR